MGIFGGWLAGDSNITSKPKRVTTIECPDCHTSILKRGGKKRCSACSDLHQRAQKKKYREAHC